MIVILSHWKKIQLNYRQTTVAIKKTMTVIEFFSEYPKHIPNSVKI